MAMTPSFQQETQRNHTHCSADKTLRVTCLTNGQSGIWQPRAPEMRQLHSLAPNSELPSRDQETEACGDS